MNLKEFENFVIPYGYKQEYSLKQLIAEDDGCLPSDIKYIKDGSDYYITADITSIEEDDAENITYEQVKVYAIRFNNIFTNSSVHELYISESSKYYKSEDTLDLLPDCLQILEDPINHYCYILEKHLEAVKFFNKHVQSKLEKIGYNLDWISATSVSFELENISSNLSIRYSLGVPNETEVTIKTHIITGFTTMFCNRRFNCNGREDKKFILSENAFNFEEFDKFLKEEKEDLIAYESCKVDMTCEQLIAKMNNAEFCDLRYLELHVFGKIMEHKRYVEFSAYNITKGYVLYKCTNGIVKVSGVLKYEGDINNKFVFIAYKI